MSVTRLFLVVKTNGEIWISNDPAAAKGLAGVATGGSIEIYANSPHVKVGTITGNNPTYSVTLNASATDHGNKFAKVF